jgi:hypothetical protein
MRPVRIITAFVFAAAVAVAGCTAHSTAANPSAAPAAPATTRPFLSPAPKTPIDRAQPTGDTVGPVVDRVPRASPVLADGRYDAYIRTVDTGRDRLVVDLVQVFQDKAAVTAAIQDGRPRDTAQYLSVWVRNQNPRLRTLPLARDLRLELGSGDCEAPLNHQLAKLASDARLMNGPTHAFYFTLTVQGGAVHRVQEFRTFNAC